jgi:hypothetical protein
MRVKLNDWETKQDLNKAGESGVTNVMVEDDDKA